MSMDVYILTLWFLKLKMHCREPVAWMVYTQDGQSVYVTDNPTDIKEGQRALPLYTKAQYD
jgi:hypothetical protein